MLYATVTCDVSSVSNELKPRFVHIIISKLSMSYQSANFPLQKRELTQRDFVVLHNFSVRLG
ncbi:hypothetical protein APLC1_2388 [Limnospira platensis C1]|nr:hypothetical protein APLC1_2388 [Arthrospira platensis C1]